MSPSPVDEAVEAPPVEHPAEPRPDIFFRRKIRLGASLRELWAFRELVLTLAERDLRVRYKQAALGLGWAVLAPVLLMLASWLVFTRLTRVDTHGVPYPVFSYLALLPWTFFSSALSSGGLSLTLNVPLLNKVYCPREVFPLAAILVAAVDAIISVFVLVVLFIVTGTAPKAEIYYVPLLLAILLCFTVGLTVAVSAVLVYIRDLRLVLPLVLQFGLFVTPVFYNADRVEKSPANLVVYSVLNPLVPVIDGLRRTVLFGEAPQWWPLLASGCASVVMLVGGLWVFKRLETGIADIA
jgi:ABC-2 type transport system permease protein/lipopolysaccharide transport system permease protein